MRKFKCAEADFITEYGIDLQDAARYAQRFSPRDVIDLCLAQVPPDVANESDPAWKAPQIISLILDP